VKNIIIYKNGKKTKNNIDIQSQIISNNKALTHIT